MAVWRGWRNEIVEAAIIARATGLASYSGDPETANRYIDKIFDIIELLEKNPQIGLACAKAPGFRSFALLLLVHRLPAVQIHSYTFMTRRKMKLSAKAFLQHCPLNIIERNALKDGSTNISGAGARLM